MATSKPATTAPDPEVATTQDSGTESVGPFVDATDATVNSTSEPVRPEGSKGQTLLYAYPGYAHDPGFDDLPLVTSAGLYVTADQAARILEDAAQFSPVPVYKKGE